MNSRPLAIIFLTIFIDLLGFGVVIPILPTLVVHDLSQPEFVVGIVGSLAPFMQFLFAPFWGSLSDRKGRRPVILISIVITTIGYIAFSFITSIYILIISRILSGIGSGNFSAAQAYVSDISAPEKRAKNMGLIGAAFGLGFIFGPPIGGFLKENWGVEAIGYFTAALCVINFVFAYLFLPESNRNKQTVKHSLNIVFQQIKIALNNKIIRFIFIINALFIAAFSMMQIASPLLWKQQYDYDDKEIGYIFGFIGLCSVLVQAGLIGFFVKKIGEKKMIVLGALLMAIGLFSMPLVPSHLFIPLELLAIMTIALSNGLIMPAANALVSKNAPVDKQGTVLGAMQSVGSLARTIGPLLSGFLYMFFYQAPYMIGAFLMLICLFLGFKLFKNIKE
ncbi:MAG: MFS transporter [Bacteroidota bacterium]|nr:MFS transporter [Bacteroidota bacterium]